MGLFYSYKKSGSGIDKKAPQKGRIVVFFEILLRKFWKLLEVNLLYSVFFLPLFFGYYAFITVSDFTVKMVITVLCALVFAVFFGPATAGIFKVVRNYSIERHSFIIADFKKGFTENFKKSFIVGLIDIIVCISVCAAAYVYPQIAKTQDSNMIYIMLVLSISLGAAVMMMSFYAYLMIVATDISLKNIIRNSLVLACMAIKTTLITLLLTVVISGAFVALTIYNLYTIFAFPFVPAAIVVLIICFNCYPVIKKYVIDPYYEKIGEKNPEDDEDDSEAVFEDMGGREKPVEQKNNKGRGKTIS